VEMTKMTSFTVYQTVKNTCLPGNNGQHRISEA
jgi:hypothetical protein